MKRVKVPGYVRKSKKGRKHRVKGFLRKTNPKKGKKRKLSKDIYKVKVIRDEYGRVIGTKWL